MELDYRREDMKGCILDIVEVPMETDLMRTFPILNKLSGFDYKFEGYPSPEKDRDRTIRFINYFYSKGTKLESDFPEPLRRKAACAKLAGFDYNSSSGDFHPKVSSMLRGDDTRVNRMIISFCAHHYSTEFTTLCATRDMYFRMLEDQTDPNKVKSIFTINEELRKLELSMINNDISPQVSVSLIQRMEEVKLELRPEDVATRIAQGKSPINFDPYY